MSDSDQFVEISCLRADIDNLQIEVDLLRRGEEEADACIADLEDMVDSLKRQIANLVQDISTSLSTANDAWEYVDLLKKTVREDKEKSDLYQENIEEYVNKYVLKTDYYKHYINLSAKESTNND